MGIDTKGCAKHAVQCLAFIFLCDFCWSCGYFFETTIFTCITNVQLVISLSLVFDGDLHSSDIMRIISHVVASFVLCTSVIIILS